jgi:hypothetical protein
MPLLIILTVACPVELEVVCNLTKIPSAVLKEVVEYSPVV